MRFRPHIKPLTIVLSLSVLGNNAYAEIDFARDIQPILNENCIECHGGVKAASNLSFIYEESVINFEGKSGYTVVTPGNLEDSEMYFRVTTDDEEDHMPPPEDHKALSEDQVGLIKQWIEQGAKWSGHWAFETPTKPPVPATVFDDQAKGAIDHFLLKRLEQEGLEPSPTEDAGRLLRRLSLGLTGLPPSLADLDTFETAFAKDPKKALEKIVDDLLREPSFGERWATMWLDLVRYADSGGLGQDQRRTIWAYRDWVVKAFNDDLPFDQFTIKQLAGDLLPQPTVDDLVATACQRNTQTNDEGGTDDEQFRVEAVIDRINTTWQTWGSITFGCAQCHDHPYDPLRNVEYYRFMDFYNNSADSDLEDDAPLVKVPDEPDRYGEATELRKHILSLKKAIWEPGTRLRDTTEWNNLKTISVKSDNSTQYVVIEKPTHTEFHTIGTVETKTHTLIEVPAEDLAGQPLTALKLTVLPHNHGTAVHNSEWGFLVDDLEAWVVNEGGEKIPVTFRLSVPDVPWIPTDPLQTIYPNGKNWGADSRIHHARQLILVPESPIALKENSHLALHIHCNKTGHGSHPMAIKRGHLASSSDVRWTQLETKESDAYAMRQELENTLCKLSDMPGTTVPIMQDRPKLLSRPTHVFERGNAMEKGELVVAGLPATLTKSASATDSPDRLEMARWWVSDKHPLTARVFVNRLWQQLFGVGIVPTLEDFGSSGDKPTHPELLDYLATRFQKDYDWSVKAILREIVLSHAFQQSSRVTPSLVERDPDNRLLARGPRLRLSAEMMRDQALAVSGLLSSKLGGPPVHPPLPDGVWQPFLSKDLWITAQPGDEDRYRRSIYTYIKRSIPFPTFATFDAPSREFCTPRRLTSNTPLQALVTLNEETFVDCAKALGQQFESELPFPSEDLFTQAHRLVTGRPADEDSLKELEQLYKKVKDQSPEQAGTVVAQVLLNLDETLTY